MKNEAPLIGIDWGTTNRRAYVLDESGEVIRRHADDQGILAAAGRFPESLTALLKRLEVEQADIILSGMIGSRNGWRQVPYLPVTAPLSLLADGLVEVESTLPGVRCRIVPGYEFAAANGLPDVMRGEETQAYGAMMLGTDSGWFVLPGTHSKWVRLEKGAIMEIATFMTGEMFGLLTSHGTLAALMQEREPVPAAFEAGVKAAQLGGFTHMAFACRALVVTDAMPASHAWSYLSGLLIGSELQEIRRRAATRTWPAIQIVGSPTLAEYYVAALRLFDMPARCWAPDEVYVAALRGLAGINQPRIEHVPT
jgi:2-dehydro-3-deoxygalactonokinase